MLERIDNYALLNLDIVWCYLCMESLNDLRNADKRLSTCEHCLDKCYGAKLERLTKLKSEAANKHTAVYVRLNVLKAVLAYHKGNRGESRMLLDAADDELKKVTIDEGKLAQVMSMGFDIVESRLALRASFNNVDAAIEQIIKVCFFTLPILLSWINDERLNVNLRFCECICRKNKQRKSARRSKSSNELIRNCGKSTV